MSEPGAGSPPDPDRPAHPMTASIVLVIGVVLLIVLLAVASTFA